MIRTSKLGETNKIGQGITLVTLAARREINVIQVT
jgi:hypothetical protein